jgi:tRNA (guanine37-N1)-methyltransferase
MRIDVISIFPKFFSVTELSLLGKARDAGLVTLHAHDLRDYTDDKHKSVDDIPYGGGPGMVMKPEPWGLAIDHVLTLAQEPATLILLTPAGERFNQTQANELSTSPWLIFACGRYEGIDARVAEHYRNLSTEPSANLRVCEMSIGDYVVAGGESAALVVIEAVTRLIPEVLGNEESAVSESFANPSEPTKLEAPAFTRPEVWRGLQVPAVLRSGDHGAIRAWRDEHSVTKP